MSVFSALSRSRATAGSAHFTTTEIEDAAASYDRAGDQARSADRARRNARKLLDRVSDGRYGAWRVEHVDSGRETPDLEEIRKLFAACGLGPVPMKATAPMLKVTRIR